MKGKWIRQFSLQYKERNDQSVINVGNGDIQKEIAATKLIQSSSEEISISWVVSMVEKPILYTNWRNKAPRQHHFLHFRKTVVTGFIQDRPTSSAVEMSATVPIVCLM